MPALSSLGCRVDEGHACRGCPCQRQRAHHRSSSSAMAGGSGCVPSRWIRHNGVAKMHARADAPPISHVVYEVKALCVGGYLQYETAIGTCCRLDYGVSSRLRRKGCRSIALRHPSSSRSRSSPAGKGTGAVTDGVADPPERSTDLCGVIGSGLPPHSTVLRLPSGVYWKSIGIHGRCIGQSPVWEVMTW